MRCEEKAREGSRRDTVGPAVCALRVLCGICVYGIVADDIPTLVCV